jgi:hypothetical protein
MFPVKPWEGFFGPGDSNWPKPWWQDVFSRCRAGVTGSMKTGPAMDGIVTEGVAGAAIPTDHNHKIKEAILCQVSTEEDLKIRDP